MTNFRDEAEKIAKRLSDTTVGYVASGIPYKYQNINDALDALTALHEREVERIIGDIGKNINPQDYWRYDGELRGKIILSDIQRRRANGEGEE